MRDLVRLASKIKKHLVNPRKKDQSLYAVRSVWYWGEQDWRLIPDVWFKLMTPYLAGDTLWGGKLLQLKGHTAGNYFWSDYEQLQKEASTLAEEYNKAAQEIGEVDQAFYAEWVKFKDRIADYF